MKKKTSLWISGITTVAMLAVAVGSFAAWNQLSGSTEAFSAQTDTPTVLEVETVSGFTANKTLAPTTTTATDFKDENDVQELTATFTPTLTEGAVNSKITYAIDTNGSDTDLFTTYLDAKLYNGDTEVATDAALTSGTPYTLKVTFKPAYADGDDACTAEKVTTP